MAKLTIICIIMLIFSVFTVSGMKYYNETGGDNSYFQSGNSLFNIDHDAVLGAAVPYSRSLSSSTPSNPPLATDLNNDGITEVIYQDGVTLRIYQEKTLNPITTYTLSATDGGYSPLYSYDIDGDGNRELIIGIKSTDSVDILRFDGSNINLIKNIGLNATLGYNDGEMIFKCKGINDCIAIFTDDKDSLGAAPRGLYISKLTNESLSSSTKIVSGTTAPICFPRIPYVAVADYDGVNGQNYIFSGINPTAASEIFILYISSNSTSVYLDRTKYVNGYGYSFVNQADWCKTNGINNDVTSPLVFNADSFSGGTMETIIGISLNSDEFGLYAYDSSGSQVSEHPYLSNGDGLMISNPVRMTAFPSEDSYMDYCVMGYNPTNQFLDLLCGSMIHTYHTVQTIEFFTHYSGYNITHAATDYNPQLFGTESYSNNFNGYNTDEILNTYGYYELTRSNCPDLICGLLGTCAGFNDCKLNLIYDNAQKGTVIPIDLEGVGFDDYISITPTNIIYVDDKYTNNKPTLCSATGDCKVNPSNPIQINTTIGVTLKGYDEDESDLVSYRTIFYYGDPNEYATDWSSNITDGNQIIQTGIANKTISNGKIRLQITDNFAPLLHVVSLDYLFTVANTGNVYGSSETEIGGKKRTGAVTNATTITELSPSNAVTTSVNSFASMFGFSSLIVWIMLMVVAGFVTLQTSRKDFGFGTKESMVVLAGVEVVMLIFGILFGFLGIGIIITIVVISLLIASVYLRKLFTGSAN